MNTHSRIASGIALTAVAATTATLLVAPASSASTQSGIGATVAAQETRASAAKPPIIYDPIPYGAKRKAEMASYALRHYGTYTYDFSNPKVVLLHFTVTRNYRSTWN